MKDSEIAAFSPELRRKDFLAEHDGDAFKLRMPDAVVLKSIRYDRASISTT